MVYKKVLVLNTKNKIPALGLYGCMCLLVVMILGGFHFVAPMYLPLEFDALQKSPWII